MNELKNVIKIWDTDFQALYYWPGSAQEEERSFLLGRSVAGRSCVCVGDSYIWTQEVCLCVSPTSFKCSGRLYRKPLPVTGDPTSQPNQSEAALPALLEAGGVAILTARTEPGRHQSINGQGDAEWETSVSLRDKLELLWNTNVDNRIECNGNVARWTMLSPYAGGCENKKWPRNHWKNDKNKLKMISWKSHPEWTNRALSNFLAHFRTSLTIVIIVQSML